MANILIIFSGHVVCLGGTEIFIQRANMYTPEEYLGDTTECGREHAYQNLNNMCSFFIIDVFATCAAGKANRIK